jgi:hypothetical protein
VHPYFPLARLVVSATLVVFRPYPGARLLGIVNKLSDDYIGLVIMGFMNVVIKAPEVRSDLKSPAFGSSSWVSSKNPSHSISVGDSVAFRVVEVKHEGTYVTLTGSLKEKDTGNVAVVGLGGAVGGETPAAAAAAEVTTAKKNKDKAEKVSKKKTPSSKRKKDEEKSGDSNDEENGAAEGGGDKKKRRKEKEKDIAATVEATKDDGRELKGSKEKKKEKKEKKRKKGGGDGD